MEDVIVEAQSGIPGLAIELAGITSTLNEL
jgi:hypothetical protein